MKLKNLLLKILFIFMLGIFIVGGNFEYTTVEGYLLIKKELGWHLEFKHSGKKLEDCLLELSVMQGDKKEEFLYKTLGKNNFSSFLFACGNLPMKDYYLDTTWQLVSKVAKCRCLFGKSLCMTKDIENLKYKYEDGKINGNFEINVMNVIKCKLCFEAVAKDDSVEVKKMGILSKKSDDIKDALIFFDSSSNPK